MAAPTANPLNSPFFGLELEIFLRPKQTKVVETLIAKVGWDRAGRDRNRVRGRLYHLVQALLLDAGIDAETEADGNFVRWFVTGDGTLTGGEEDGFWGVELVSPILHASKNWRHEVNDLFKALSLHFDIKVDRSYGTHVHVSPGVRPWTHRELAAILKAAALYNESIVEMLPPDRKDNGFAVSNFAHENVPPALRAAHSAALASGDYRGVFTLLDSLTSPSQFAEFYGSRWFMFNMTNLNDSPTSTGTVEFRSAPASADARTAIHWAAWVLSFMLRATSTDWSAAGGPMAPVTRGGSVTDLRRFILAGKVLLPAESRDGIDHSRLRRVGGTSPFTAAEKEEMEELKKDKEEKPKRFGNQ
ncbi:hypothetical protein F503_06538 [Ophiostoma piceae UAMH 11346]|uniref:Amidoligase enzyme n=1 Tax=Ophiostoma piceae (strain UAMH 11346) TaxID=1262450 RepID=S3C822_OPHP1|nr:hypothetical protein F503_06538 [Ophiostoma piceae UAMH 11346]